MLTIPECVRPFFTEAGWILGRWVAVNSEVPVDHPAAAILAEFGGLQVGRTRRASASARSTILFEHQDTARDPLLARWEELLDTKLVYVGHCGGKYDHYLVDGHGRWFQASALNPSIDFLGYTFAEAVENILFNGFQHLNSRRVRPDRPIPNRLVGSCPSVRAALPISGLPTSVRPFFDAAGWTPERRVLAYRGVSADHPAAAVLASFAGLHVGESGAGLECARSDIEFGWDDIEDDGQLAHWQNLLGVNFVLVAHFYRGDCHLLVDDLGRYFSSNNISWGVCFDGDTFGEALERILLGILPFNRMSRSAPFLRPARPTE